jgi:hypothetical protein
MAIQNQGWAYVSGSSASGTPGGADTNIQFNNAGAFGGSSDLTWDGSTVATTDISASINISASAFYGDGSNLTGITASAVNVADGPEFAIQWRYDTPASGDLSGSQALTWNTSSLDLTVTGNVRLADSYEFYGDLEGAVRFPAVNDEGASISKGQAIYIKGVSGQTPTVALAACDDEDKMPAFGLAGEDATNGASVQIVTFGSLQNLNLTSLYGQTFAVGDTAYVQTGSGGTSGSLTPTRPTGSSNFIQNMGEIVRNGGGGDGQIKITGPGRANATPNLDTGYLFVGNDTNCSVQDNTVFISSSANMVGINNINPDHALSVTGDISASVNVSASAFYGDGSNLTNLPGGGGGGIFTELDSSNAYTTSSLSIGTSGAPGATLHVSSSGDEALFRVDGLTETGPVLFVTGSGRVAIGHDSPAYALSVNGNVEFGNGSGGGYLISRGDINTYLQFGVAGSDSMALVAGGKQFITIDNNTTSSNDYMILGTTSTDNTYVSGNLIVCDGTASVTHLSGCSPIQVHAPMQLQSGDSLSFNGSSNTAKITNNGSNLDFNSPGSIVLSSGNNNISSSANISASAFYGDGSNLTGLSSDTVDTTTDASNATFYVPFVNQSTGQNGETLYIHDVLSINPSSSLVKISETGDNAASLVLSSSTGDSIFGGAGRRLGSVGFAATPGSTDTSILIAGGYVNMGGGNQDLLTIHAPNNDGVIQVSASSETLIEGANITFTGDAVAESGFTSQNGIEVNGAQSNFSAAVSITGSSDVGLNVSSVYTGGASILSIGNILAGHTGGGAHTAHLNSSGEISGSAAIMGATARFGGLNFEGNKVLTSDDGTIMFGATADQDLRANSLFLSGGLAVGGAQQISFGTKLTGYTNTIASPFYRVYPVDTSALTGSTMVILPAISAATHGLELTIKDIGNNAGTYAINVTGATGSGDKIETSTAYKAIAGNNWWSTIVAQSGSSGTHVWYQIAGRAW